MQKEIREIVRTHNLGRLLSYKKLGGYSNKNYKVTTTQDYYFFKFYSKNYSKEHISSVNETLSKINLSFIPKILFSNLNCSNAYCVMNFIESDKYKKSLKELKEAAKILALFHLHAKKVKPKSYIIWDIYKFPEIQGNFIEDLSLKDYREIFNSEYKSIPKRYQWIHRDFSPNNLLFKDYKAVALVDFDIIAFGNVEYDLVLACKEFSVDTDKKPYKFDLNRIKKFVKEYSNINKINLKKDEVYLYLFHILLKGAIDNSKEYSLNKKKVNLLITRYFIQLLDDLMNRKEKIVSSFVN